MQGGVRKKGNRWYYYFDAGKVNGKRKRIERKGGNTKKEALEALRKALYEFEKCGSLVSESDISVADYFDYWFKEYVLINCKYNTQRGYNLIIEKHIKPTLGIYKLKSLTPAMLQEFINKKYRNGFTKNTLKGFYGVLSGALKMAVYPYQFIKENPMQYVSMPKYNSLKKDNEDLKIITVDEFNKIVDRFPFGSSFYIPLQIAFNTGMRASEVCGLTWDCINLEEGKIKVEKIILKKGMQWCFGTPKTASSQREILIGKTLIDILKKHKKYQLENRLKYGEFYSNNLYKFEEINKKYSSTDLVCTKENGELVSTDSLKYLSRVVNYELGINFNFHSLRHTHATILLEAGANIKDIQKRLGHSKLATTMDTYSHITDKMNQDSVNIFEGVLSSKIK
ncbi:site-specific integrase [Tepidibacter formicigenes]|jgi:ATP-dependent helicase/nuclease subunit A|uniref:Site-specific recombinase XerD n=1 Tax=Tepidibacter formicigenes DSM 15518 TaxID=1123349 RepID=A0A1M6N8S6_9FIRM|nr:site-specific integrase [Tepidibacter formicigenes]SHJ92034.1 Site-specific recombinase XerD [Tepidibacter formicigenes DSM 15518]